jgi:hypothetical protein
MKDSRTGMSSIHDRELLDLVEEIFPVLPALLVFAHNLGEAPGELLGLGAGALLQADNLAAVVGPEALGQVGDELADLALHRHHLLAALQHLALAGHDLALRQCQLRLRVLLGREGQVAPGGCLCSYPEPLPYLRLVVLLVQALDYA